MSTALRAAGRGVHADTGRSSSRRLVPVAALSAIAAGAGAVLLLWVHATPAVLRDPGSYLTAAGRILGLLAGYAVIVQLLLMGRLPVLECGVGADRLARWHSFGGRYTISLIAGHVVLITCGYAVTGHTGVPGQFVDFVRSYPDVLMAVVAAGLFLGVGILSARAARARMRYETWYYLHFYTYLAIALAFAHQIAVGADFVGDRTARLLWTGMYVLAGASVVWYRLMVPVRAAFRHRLRVLTVVPEAPGVVSVVLYGQRLEELGAEPGQFFRWRFLTRGSWWQSHPYSLSAPPHPPYLRITVKAVGDHTRALQRIRPGTRVAADGPYGALVHTGHAARKVLLIAGGLGITPLRALFETIPARTGGLTLIYRAHTRGSVVFGSELQRIARERGARVHFLLGPRTQCDPFTPDGLRGLVPDIAAHEVYLCGPPGMAAAATTALRGARVPRRRIHRESFEL